MRKLNSDEINLLNSDLIPFEIFLKTNGLLSDKVSSKYEGINFHIESKQGLGEQMAWHELIHKLEKEI